MNLGRRSGRAVGILLLVALGLAAVAGVMAMLMRHDGGDTSATGRSSVNPRFITARGGVCSAAVRARTGDVTGARILFFAQSHETLHQLAAAVKDKDRDSAARLLEAKGQVEASFERSGADLAASLEVLAQEAGQAMWSLSGNDPGACPPQP